MAPRSADNFDLNQIFQSYTNGVVQVFVEIYAANRLVNDFCKILFSH